uniref:Arginine/serine-rich coiled-coil protein 2 n=2 Tax=Schistocephalus solidus TaxID=70667 RepID=A0A0X3NUJ1_SCHSO
MAAPIGMLCDYESSVDDSTEEPQQVSGPMEQPEVPNKSPRSSSSSSSDEKSIDSPKQKPSLPRQYRSKQQSSRDKNSRSRSRSSSSHRSRDRRDRHSERRDRHYRRRPNRSSDLERHKRRDSSRHRHRRSSGRHHHRSRSRHGGSRSSSHRNRFDDKRCGPSRSRLANGVTRRDLESRPDTKPLEPPKPIDPAVAAKEVAAKASAMIASAMSRNLAQSATDANGLPRIDPKDILAKIQETQLAQAKAQAEAAAVAANIPKFYNPLSVNAAKLAEQQQKRKLLWSKKTADTKEVRLEHSPLRFFCCPSLFLFIFPCLGSATRFRSWISLFSNAITSQFLYVALVCDYSWWPTGLLFKML